MKKINGFIRRNLVRLAAIAIIMALFFLARLPNISNAEREGLAKQYSFKQYNLPEETSGLDRKIREVAPSLERISGWISSVGAGIALNDIDGDGLSNDLCKVDPRTDNVMIAPAPTTGERFAPFTLDPGGLFKRPQMAPMGCIPNDYNEDGLMDMLVYYWGRTPIVFIAKGQKPSRENYIAQEAVKSSEAWFTGAATVADLDRDGHLDVVIGNYFADGSEIIDPKSSTQQFMPASMSMAFNGGRSRILRWKGAQKGETPSVEFEEVRDYLDVEDQQEESDMTHGWTLAIGACDLDGDLFPEVYFANDFAHDRFLHNRSVPGKIRFVPLVGKKHFTTPKSKVIGKDSFKGMGIDYADLNGDGMYDFFISNIADEYALEESHSLYLSTGKPDDMGKGKVPYNDHAEELGVSRSSWGWDTKIADFNNDGVAEIFQAVGFLKGEISRWPELHEAAMGNDQLLPWAQNWHKIQAGDDLSGQDHNPFYAKAKDGRFYDLAPQLKLDRKQVTRGVATADVNGDGKIDFAIANQWDTSFFYLNEAQGGGGFLGLHLRLPLEAGVKRSIEAGHPKGATRAAIGAQVSIKLPNGETRVGFSDGGNGHSGKRGPEVHFGLGDIPKGSKLQAEVKWVDRNGNPQKYNFETESGWHTVVLGEN